MSTHSLATSIRVLFAGMLLWPILVQANEASSSQLSSAIDQLFSKHAYESKPGCAVGVIHNGEYIHEKGYGLANLEYEIPITTETVFRTGSLSKQFTAMAIAILAQQGKLDLDIDVHNYLPDLAEYESAVTLRQMIHHLAGMGDYDHAIFSLEGKSFRFGNQDYWTTSQFYGHVAKAMLLHEPGTKWKYSNLAYFLLGQVVESVSGKSLRDFAAENIFIPLGMVRTSFNDDANRIVPKRADGYRLLPDGSYVIYMTNLDWVGDGGVFTNLDDFILWDRNFDRNRIGNQGQALIDIVTTPHPLAVTSSDEREFGYAYGLGVGESNGEVSIGHSGSMVGFTSFYVRYPARSLSIVVFCNSTDANAPKLGNAVARLAVGSLK